MHLANSVRILIGLLEHNNGERWLAAIYQEPLNSLPYPKIAIEMILCSEDVI